MEAQLLGVLVVSRGLTWRWFPHKPPLSNIKGQTATPLLKSYISEMLEMKAIVPTTGKVVQSRLFPVDKKGTTKREWFWIYIS